MLCFIVMNVIVHYSRCLFCSSGGGGGEDTISSTRGDLTGKTWQSSSRMEMADLLVSEYFGVGPGCYGSRLLFVFSRLLVIFKTAKLYKRGPSRCVWLIVNTGPPGK